MTSLSVLFAATLTATAPHGLIPRPEIVLAAPPSVEEAVGTVSVKAPPYNARGDGVTDDAPAINAALASGRSVYVPSGSYLLGSTILLPSGSVLRGAGRETVLVVPDSGFDGERVMTNEHFTTGDTKIAVSDLTLKVTHRYAVSGADPGIMRFERVTGLTIERIYTDPAYSSERTPVDLSGGNHEVTVSGCKLVNKNDSYAGGGALWIRGGRLADPGLDSSDITIVNNELEAAHDEALGIYGWMNTVSRVAITGNIVRNRGADSELALAVLGYNVSGQHGRAQDVAISCNVLYGALRITTGAHRVSIKGVTVWGPVQGTRSGVFIGESVTGLGFPSDVVMSDSTVHGSTAEGVFAGGVNIRLDHVHVISAAKKGIYAGPGVTVTNCTVSDTPTGIEVRGGAGSIQANKVFRTTTGILAIGQVDGQEITDNEIVDASATALAINGGGGIVNRLVLRNNVVRGPTVVPRVGIRVYNGKLASCIAEGNRVLDATTSWEGVAGAGCSPGTVSANRGDEDVTLVAGVDAEEQRFAAKLTANRRVTLSTTGVVPGVRFRIVRSGLDGFALDVGPGLKIIPPGVAAFVEVTYDGSSWVVTGYGTL